MIQTGVNCGDLLYEGIFRLHEGSHYNYNRLGHTFIKSITKPDQSEIAAIDKGKARIGLIVRENVIIIVFNFGSFIWETTHYNWWFNPPELRPDPIAELSLAISGISLRVFLVDSSNGKIVAARTCHIPESFSRSLIKQAALQVHHDFDPWHHLEIFQEFLKQYPEGKEQLKQAICVFSQGHDGRMRPAEDSIKDVYEGLSIEPSSLQGVKSAL